MHQIQGEGIGKRFGRRVLFRKLAFSAVPGRRLAITGSNGSGKSTLVRIIAGVMLPTRGSVTLRIDGTEIDAPLRSMHMGLVAPYLNLYDAFTPRENLRFVARARGMKNYKKRIQDVLEEVHLAPRSDDMVGTFSSGMKQRMRFAFALFSGPTVLLLDEPTANLDQSGVEMVADIVARAVSGNQIVIIATNDRAEAEACDEILCVEDFR